jgi:outer membrane protein assembly factor BamB
MSSKERTAWTSLTLFATMALAVASSVHANANWPQFRGAEARGVAEGDALPVEWSATKNVEWKADIPGRGWSSPVVWGDRVFFTSVVNLGESEDPKKGLYFGGDRPDAPESVHQRIAYCLDLESGDVLWQHQVHEGAPKTGIHIKNSFASETPVTDGERVYFYFGNIGVFCFDFDGQLLWSKALKAHETRYGWGTAASPVLHGDRLYIVNDNEEDSYLLALDKGTGNEVWRVARDEGSNWSTPYIWDNGQRTEIITPGTGKVRSYDLGGNLLWSLAGMSSITIATPYAAGGLLYISSGYVGDRDARPIYAIRPGAQGDISLVDGETSNKWIAWCQPMAAPYNPTTLVYGDRLYVLMDRGGVVCFNSATGETVYEDERLPRGSGFTSSPWAYGGNIYCLSEDGATYVLKAGDAFDLLRTNSLADDDMGMATPAIAGDRLLIRTAARIYCIRNGAGE